MIQRIVPCGRIILVCYYGHEGGPEELEAVHRFCRQLPQAQFNVLSYQFINQRNQPPVLFCIERKHQRTVDYSSVSDVFIFLQRASLIPVGSTDPKIANRDLRNQTQMSLPSHVPAFLQLHIHLQETVGLLFHN